jgi:hypothetical protein
VNKDRWIIQYATNVRCCAGFTSDRHVGGFIFELVVATTWPNAAWGRLFPSSH